jgi:hypothetical protein
MNPIEMYEIDALKKRTEDLTKQFKNYFGVCQKVDPAYTRQAIFELFMFQQIAGLQLGMDHLLKLVEDSLAQKEKTKLEIIK